jgi:hypothetical protein
MGGEYSREKVGSQVVFLMVRGWQTISPQLQKNAGSGMMRAR